jgi:hypothetical protein
MTIKISNYVIPVKHETLSQTVVVDTYYRQTHIPKSYWEIFQDVFCIVDFTCSQNSAVDYMEGLVSDAYTCNCYGTNYLGMPTIYFDFSEAKTSFGMSATDYTFTPYLNYTNSAQSCPLAINGPPLDIDQFNNLDEPNLIVIGQRFFAQFTLAQYVSRTNGTYTLIVSGGSEATPDLKSFAIIISSTIVVIIIMSVITMALLIVRRRRLEAD